MDGGDDTPGLLVSIGDFLVRLSGGDAYSFSGESSSASILWCR